MVKTKIKYLVLIFFFYNYELKIIKISENFFENLNFHSFSK